MACLDLRLKILFILVPLWKVSMATDDEHNHSEHSSDFHDVLNRTVVLNSASEHYLAIIFYDYSGNRTEKISAARFKDLLRDLNLGGKVAVTKASPSQESSDSHNRHARSSEQQERGFGPGFSAQRIREKRQSAGQYKRREQLEYATRGNPARTRDRKRRHTDEHRYSDTHEGHKEVRYFDDFFFLRFLLCKIC